jgi:hypothetical protein
MKMETCARKIRWRAGGILVSAALFSLICGARLAAQIPRDQAGVQELPSNTPRGAAPKDLTGYWVSVVTERWRYRMMVPDKNDFQYVPLNPEGRKMADTWDPAKDQAAGLACKGYGAPAIVQVPGRLHIYWQDDSTLRIDADSGTQTRLFHFVGSSPESAEPTWQGYSAASWEGSEFVDTRDGQGGPVLDSTGKRLPRRVLKQADILRVVTSRIRPGYVQKNGIPYSANATLEEFYDTFKDPYSGNTWLTVTTVVTDPQYLIEPLFTHAHFKKSPDASGWDPTPCRTDVPR